MIPDDERRLLVTDETATIAEPAAERRPRVLMLTDITTDMRETDHEVDSVRSAAEAAGFGEPILINVDDVHVNGVLETLREAREAGTPFDIVVEDIWSRPDLLGVAKAEQPGLFIVSLVSGVDLSFMRQHRPEVDAPVRNYRGYVQERTSDLITAFQSARQAMLPSQPAPTAATTV